MLEKAGLPRFTSTVHIAERRELLVRWDHGFVLRLDLSHRYLEPIDDSERAAILDQPADRELIDVYVPASSDDPRYAPSAPA